MQPIQLDDQLFIEAKRRAHEAGFASVDEYVAEVLADDLQQDNFDHLFTPERLAHLDRISAGIKKAGNSTSIADIRKHFEQKRAEWPARRQS